MYRTTELKVPAGIQSQPEDNTASSAPTSFGEHMQALDSVARELLMPHVTA